MRLEGEPTAPSAEDVTDIALAPLETILEEGERLFSSGQTDQAIQQLEAARRRYYEGGDANSEGAVLRTLANCEFSLDHSREAERYLELACERYSQAHQTNTAADLYLSLGDLRAKMDESKRARDAYLIGAKLYRQLDDPLGQGHAEYKLGSLHAKTNHDMALRHFNFAATLYDRADERTPADDSLRVSNPHLPEHFEDCRRIETWLMARVARREADRLRTEIGPMAEAKPEPEAPPPPTANDVMRGLFVFLIVPAVFIGAVFIVTKLPAFPFSTSQTVLMPIALLAGALSMVMARMNGVESRVVQWVGAIIVCVGVQVANAALTKNHTIPDPDETGARAAVAESLSQLAVAADAPPDLAKERQEIVRVLTIARERGDRPGEASALRRQADLERRAGATSQVTVLYSSALEIYRELDDKPRQLEVLVPLGEMHASLKHYAQAREAYTQAADLYAQRQDPLNQAKLLILVGDLEKNMERPKQARSAYVRAVELNRAGNDPIAEARSLLRLGKLDADLQATEPARKAYSAALALSEQRGDVGGQADALLHLGELEVGARKYPQAIALYDRAMALYAADEQHIKGRVRVLQVRGDLERNRKQLPAAREYYLQALKLSEEKDGGAQVTEILMALADATAAMGDADQARDTYMRALGRQELANDVEGQIMTLRRLSQLTAKSNVALAQQYAKRAATLQESVAETATN